MADGKRSDLGVRTVSAVAMVALAGGAVWAGGWVWATFVFFVAAGVLWEWLGLARRIAASPAALGLWNVAGVVYVGFGAAMLLFLHSPLFPIATLLSVVGAVVATDIGAYFAGRTFGGPKIAPSISPSKTWAGLAGGMIGASAVFLTARTDETVAQSIAAGVLLAVVAQAGDFFESWMKRRAGVKDSGSLIPGHGGMFDRVDGLLAVLFVGGVATLAGGLMGAQ